MMLLLASQHIELERISLFKFKKKLRQPFWTLFDCTGYEICYDVLSSHNLELNKYHTLIFGGKRKTTLLRHESCLIIIIFERCFIKMCQTALQPGRAV